MDAHALAVEPWTQVDIAALAAESIHSHPCRQCRTHTNHLPHLCFASPTSTLLDTVRRRTQPAKAVAGDVSRTTDESEALALPDSRITLYCASFEDKGRGISSGSPTALGHSASNHPLDHHQQQTKGTAIVSASLHLTRAHSVIRNSHDISSFLSSFRDLNLFDPTPVHTKNRGQTTRVVLSLPSPPSSGTPYSHTHTHRGLPRTPPTASPHHTQPQPHISQRSTMLPLVPLLLLAYAALYAFATPIPSSQQAQQLDVRVAIGPDSPAPLLRSTAPVAERRKRRVVVQDESEDEDVRGSTPVAGETSMAGRASLLPQHPAIISLTPGEGVGFYHACLGSGC